MAAADFADRYTDIRRQVRVYLRGVFQNNIDIDEVTDAVMEKLLVHWEKIDEPVRWAITAARHLAVDELRKKTAATLGSLNSREVMEYGNVDQQQRITQIVEALRQLPRSEQLVITLVALGYDTEEISEHAGLSVQTVYHYTCAARKKLERILPYSRRKEDKQGRSGPATGPEPAH